MSDGGFARLMSSTNSSLLVVTTAAGGDKAGCLVGFHTQSSMSPEQYCIWLSKANHTYRVSLRAEHFALHFLTADDYASAEHFGAQSGDTVDKFATVPAEVGPGGVPLIRVLPHRLVVERIAMLDDGGDHVCLTTRVVSAASSAPFDPLRLSHISDLVPGHSNDERAIHP